MKILGIDPGKRYIGLAMADDEVRIAMPFRVLDIKNRNPLHQELEKIIQQEKIEKIVIGYPMGMSGELTEQTKIIEQVIKTLEKHLSVPVIKFDERLSSKMADKLLSGQKQNHAVAANIILQDYLDKQL